MTSVEVSEIVKKYYEKYGILIQDKTILEKFREQLWMFYNEHKKKSRITISEFTVFLKGPVPCYSNLPSGLEKQVFIRTEYITAMKDAITNNTMVLNIQGITGIGKSYLAAAFAKECVRDCSIAAKAIVWLEDKNGALTLNSLLSTILSVFCSDSITDLSPMEMENEATKKLKEYKTVIVIDNFETVKHESYDDLLTFIFKMQGYTIFLLVSGTHLINCMELRKRSHLYKEIQLDKISLGQWKQIIDVIRKQHPKIEDALVKSKSKKYVLSEYIYDFCEGIPLAMMLMLGNISNILQNGGSFCEHITNSAKGLNARDVFWEVLKALKVTKEMECLLSCLSLFAIPATAAELAEVSGLKGVDDKGFLDNSSDLFQAIAGCTDQFIIEVIDSAPPRYSIPSIVRNVYRPSTDGNVLIDNFIKYYKGFLGKIDYCFNGFRKLEALDSQNGYKEADNIVAILDYCYVNNRWQDYYDISNASRYYFYTRGESGVGENSVHYKRYQAAVHLGNIKDQYSSLLYHCNVSCKTKSLEGMDKCFEILAELRNNESVAKIERIKLDYNRGLYYFAQGRYKDALPLYAQYLKDNRGLCDAQESFKDQLNHDYVACLRWKSECCYMIASSSENTGSDDQVNLDETIADLDESIYIAKEIAFERSIVHALFLKYKILKFKHEERETIERVFIELNSYKENVIDKDFMFSKDYMEMTGYSLRK